MLTGKQLQKDRKLVNCIDWTMTPRNAIEMYFEWGTGWVRGNDFVSGHNDESIYFVVYDFDKTPMVTLSRRTTAGAEKISQVEIPADLFEAACREDGKQSGVGVHALN